MGKQTLLDINTWRQKRWMDGYPETGRSEELNE